MGKRNQYQSIFRAANFLGLFPVSGLFTSSKTGNEDDILPFRGEFTIPIIPFPPLFVTL